MFSLTATRYPQPEIPRPILIDGFDEPVEIPAESAEHLFAAAYRAGVEVDDVLSLAIKYRCCGRDAVTSAQDCRIARALKADGAFRVDDLDVDDDTGTLLQAWAYRAGVPVITVLEELMRIGTADLDREAA